MTTLTTRGLAPVREVLPNGAVVIVKETATRPAVTLSAAFQAGSAYDPDQHLGLAHFVSRVIDRGTTVRSADDIADQLDNRGVTLSLGLTRHVLTLSSTCLAEDFQPVLDLVVDIARNASFPEEEIAKRRGEIITGIRQDEDNPAIRATEALMQMLYPDAHPYGRKPKGSVEHVESIQRADLLSFHRDRFTPSSLSLAIVGDVETERATSEAVRALADWPATPTPRLVPPSVPRPSTRRRLVIQMMNKVQADIAYGFTTITRLDPKYYTYWLMNNVLGQYALGGRLGDSIRERQGMAYYVFSSFDANLAEGPLVIRAGVNPSNVDRAIASIDEEIDRMATQGITARELRDSKQYLIGSLPRMLETNTGIATFLQTAEHFGLGLDHDLRLPDLLGSVTLDEVNSAARAVLAREHAAVVVAGPYAD